METELYSLIMYCIPALITGVITYLFFKEYTNNENKRRHYILHKSLQKEVLPVKLQAYERLALVLERMTPNNLLIRIQPISQRKQDYEQLLIQTIEQEFEHNLAQQIYVSEECWNIILTAKNTTIQFIRNSDLSNESTTADKFRELVLTKSMDRPSPSTVALAYLKNEVSNLLTY
jgi:hypothetical protein